MLVSVRQDREGHWHALCELDGRRVAALAGPRTGELIGQRVQVAYSRVDADGGLREAQITTTAGVPDAQAATGSASAVPT